MAGLREIRRLKHWLENSDNENMRIAWYSEKQRNALWHLRHSHSDGKVHPIANVWITPDNKEVIATSVSSGYDHGCGWDDMRCLGPVIKWKKSLYHIHTVFPNYDDAKINTFGDGSIKSTMKKMSPYYNNVINSNTKNDTDVNSNINKKNNSKI